MKTKNTILFFMCFILSVSSFANINYSGSSNYKLNDESIESLFSESTEIEYSNLSEIQGILLPTASLPTQLNDDNKKIIAGLLGIFCGSLGLHRFYLGHNQSGFIYLGATLVSGVAGIFCPFLWAVPSVVGLLGLIDGIMILIDETGTKYNDKKKLIMWMDK
jgi:TM2 domain-containing membrane protein YozV